jgi:hypothetical protein
MAQLTGVPGMVTKAGPGSGTAVTASVDNTAVNTLGSRQYDVAGNEYVYLQGVASTILGSVVTYNSSTGATTLIAANAIGPVAVAMGAFVASTFGWYCVKGIVTAACDAGIVSGAALYIDGTAGRCDDTVVAGDLIAGAFARSTDTSNLCTLEINYPFVTDTLS